MHRGEGALGWIARNSAKPGREEGYDNWIAQAAPGWSRDHLELDREEAIAPLLDLMAKTLGIDLPKRAYAAAHRWRFARVERALGTPCLYDADLGIGLAGDGFLGGRIEAAFDSGHALAGRLLEPAS